MLRSFSEFKYFQSIRIPVEDSDEIRFLVEIENEEGESEYLEDARLMEVSIHGLGFTTTRRLSIGEDLRISLHFRKLHLDLEANIIRSFSGGPQDQRILYGVEFIEDESEEVKRYLEQYIYSFSYDRLRDCLVQMSLADRYSSATQGLEMFSLMISLFKDMTNFADREDFIDSILEEISRIMNAQRASVFLINPDSNELQAVAAIGADKKILRFDYRKGIAGSVFTTGVALNIDTIHDTSRFSNELDQLTGFNTKSIICNPLHNREDKIIGVIEVLNKHNGDRFSVEDEKIMKVVSLIFSSVFHNYNPLSQQSSVRRFSAPTDREFIMIGRSRHALAIRSTIVKLKDLDNSVLFFGDQGVGKSLLSRIIHNEGTRGIRPFEEVFCATKDLDVLERDVLGAKEVPSKLESAGGGSILFRDIHALPLKLQDDLVSKIEEKTSPGGNLSFDIRFFATTSKNLEKMVADGRFNHRLYTILSEAYVEIPPLRKRPEDIKDLINYFLRVECRRQGFLLKNLSPAVMNSFLEYDWPGNVKELKTAIARLVLYNPKNHVISSISNLATPIFQQQSSSNKLFDSIPFAVDERIALKDRLALIERQLILHEIKRHHGNKSKAAREMGISREALRKKLLMGQEILESIEGNKDLAKLLDEESAA